MTHVDEAIEFYVVLSKNATFFANCLYAGNLCANKPLVPAIFLPTTFFQVNLSSELSCSFGLAVKELGWQTKGSGFDHG